MPQTGLGGSGHSGGRPLWLGPQSSVSAQQRIGRRCCKRGGTGKLDRQASEKRALPHLGGGHDEARQGVEELPEGDVLGRTINIPSNSRAKKCSSGRLLLNMEALRRASIGICQ